MSKYVKAEDKPIKKQIDYEKLIEALTELIPTELIPKIEELTKTYTSLVDPEDSPVKLTVKMADEGGVNEGLVDTLKSWAKKLTSKFNNWISSYDKKLAKIKEQAAKDGLVFESMSQEEFELLVEKRWSAAVKTKWEPSAGFFDGSATSIAKGLKDASKDLKQAMSRLNFYVNRAGKNLDDKAKTRLEHAKDKLSALYA